jgi:hypothetical protein
MADAGADQYTFHLEATSDDEVEGLCRQVREFYTVDPSFLLIAAAFGSFHLLKVYFSCKNSTFCDGKVRPGSGSDSGSAWIPIGLAPWNPKPDADPL